MHCSQWLSKQVWSFWLQEWFMQRNIFFSSLIQDVLCLDFEYFFQFKTNAEINDLMFSIRVQHRWIIQCLENTWGSMNWGKKYEVQATTCMWVSNVLASSFSPSPMKMHLGVLFRLTRSVWFILLLKIMKMLTDGTWEIMSAWMFFSSWNTHYWKSTLYRRKTNFVGKFASVKRFQIIVVSFCFPHSTASVESRLYAIRFLFLSKYMTLFLWSV